MKKKFFFAAMALVALASCSSDDLVGENNNSPNLNPAPASGEKAIVFNSGANGVTRAAFSGKQAADSLNNNFVVYGVKSDASPTSGDKVFDHYNVNYVDGTANTTTSNTDGWEYVAQTKHAYATTISAQTIKYWDYAKSQYDFIAFSKGGATAVYSNSEYETNKATSVLISAINPAYLNGVDSNTDGIFESGAYSITGKASNLAKCYIADLVTAYRNVSPKSDYEKTVQIKFRSLYAKVRIALYETVPGYSVQAGSVNFYNAADDDSPNTTAKLFTTNGDVFNEEGTYTVYYPTTGYANSPNGSTPNTDYNKAHLSFSPAASGTSTVKEFGTLDNTTYVYNDDNEDSDNNASTKSQSYIGRASNEATYAGDGGDPIPHHYTVVIPNEKGAVLNLKVNYTLVSTDGSGETINVTGATAKVPAVYASWKSGYAYTYIFKISQNSNGYTGIIDPSTGNPIGPEGLYPITFDAVVMDNEIDGVQETITTVTDPSITTYSEGKVVTENDEYTTGSIIYVVVDNGTDLTDGSTATLTKAKLYTVTLESGAAQTINEASVANALANGSEYYPVDIATGDPVTGYYVSDGGSGYTNATGTAIAGTTYYAKEAAGVKVVKDANKKKMVVTPADGLTSITEIAAADSPTGKAITVKGAKFTAGASGTIYAFEYDGGTKKHYKIIKIQ